MLTSVTARPVMPSIRLTTFWRTCSVTWGMLSPYSTTTLRSTAASRVPTSTETPWLS